ncbi:hypothetical protein ACSBR1_024495 [Camellia fascicularis]
MDSLISTSSPIFIGDDQTTDGNELISAKELQDVLKSLGEKCSWRDCLKMIKSVDVDGNGCVNFEEFKKMMNA